MIITSSSSERKSTKITAEMKMTNEEMTEALQDLHNPMQITSSRIGEGRLELKKSLEEKVMIHDKDNRDKISQSSRTPVEDRVRLIMYTLKYGNQWIKIKNWFHGKTDKAIKNLFFNITRKVIRKVFRLLQLKSMLSLIVKTRPSLMGQFFVHYCEHMKESGVDDTQECIQNLLNFAYEKTDSKDISEFHLNKNILKATLLETIGKQFFY